MRRPPGFPAPAIAGRSPLEPIGGFRGVLFAALFGLAALAPACHGSEAASASGAAREGAAASIRVETATVAERQMPRYLTVTGSLKANQESTVAADASGKVLEVLVERGQRVQRGQLVATLDARAAALGATAADAQSKLAQTELDQARRECARVDHLLETGAISRAEYDRQTSQCSAQQWSAAAAEAQQQSASKVLGDTRIRAPFDGIIGERLVGVGQYVEPSTRVATLYQPDPLRLELTIPEAEVGSAKEGVRVSFTVAAFANERFEGTMKYISPNVRESSRDLVVEAIVPNHDGRLRPGMFAVAEIELGTQRLPVVPASAVVRDDTQARVFVVGPDKQIEERLVQVGEAVGDVVAVAGGVKAGESVVVRPGPDVRDGARTE